MNTEKPKETNVVEFPIENPGDAEIIIKRSEEFKKAADVLSKHIQNLEISPDQNNRLVNLICKQIDQVERDAFLYGANLTAMLINEGTI